MTAPTTFDHPPTELLTGAFGWNYESEPDPSDSGRWRPRAWRIFYPNHMLTIDYRTHLATRDTIIYPVGESA